MYAERLPENIGLSHLSHEMRTRLAKLVIRLLDEWELTTGEKLKLLGLNEHSRNMLSHYRAGEKPIPDSQDRLERVGLLFAIYKNIFDLYPENESIRQTWIKRANKMLGDRRPLDVMLTKGIFGLGNIMRFLDLQRVM